MPSMLLAPQQLLILLLTLYPTLPSLIVRLHTINAEFCFCIHHSLPPVLILRPKFIQP